MVLRSVGQVFCRISLSWDLSDVFLMTELESWFRGRRTPMDQL
jgi:hypothetical protein